MKRSTYLSLTAIFVSFAFLVSSCSDNTTGVSSNGVNAQLGDQHLQITNTASSPVYYFVVDQDVAARILWAPTSEERNRIRPRENRNIALDDIYGYQDDGNIIVYFWRNENPENAHIENILIEQ